MSKARKSALETVIRLYGFEDEKTVMFAAMCEDPHISSKGLKRSYFRVLSVFMCKTI